jgi:hypothetical protein
MNTLSELLPGDVADLKRELKNMDERATRLLSLL